MPKTSKEKKIIETENDINPEVIAKNKATKKAVVKTKKTSNNTTTKKTAKKTTSKKTVTTNSKSTSKSTTTEKEAKTKKSTKKTTSKKAVSKKTASKKIIKKSSILEYYDLPVFYNKTIIKTLVQTPSCLFVYWEVSNEDRIKLQNQYGKNFFNDTKPFLSITNETMNYTFEVEINDYANSWYIHINDSDCKYVVKLLRKPINNEVATYIPTVDITSSNEMDAPNDHILFDKLGKTVFFKDVKTNIVTKKDITTIYSIKNIGKIYNVYDLYKEIYKKDLAEDNLNVKLSSSNFSSTFK